MPLLLERNRTFYWTNSFFPARLPYARVFPGLEEDRSWGAPPFWGDFGGRAPTAVGDQSYLGPVYGEYSYPSDPYRPHMLEQPPPSDFGLEYDILDPFVSPEDDFSGDVDNYRGVDARAVDKEARSLLYRYMGDLYRDATDTIGEPSHGAGSELDEADMELESDHGYDDVQGASGVSARAAAQLLPGDTDRTRPPAWLLKPDRRRGLTLLKECREEHAGLKLEFDNLKDTVTKLTSTLHEAELKIDELKNRSRRNNVVIYNVPEGFEPWADCVKFVSNLLAVCKLTATIQRAHRTGAKPPTDSATNPRPRSRPRPIHIAFSSYIEKEKCRKGRVPLQRPHIRGQHQVLCLR